MSEAVATLMSELEAAAKAAWKEEEAVRTRLAQEVARLERRRAFAHRRMNFVRVLATAARSCETEEAAAAGQRAAAKIELSCTRESEFHRAVLDRLQPLGLTIWRCVRGTDEGADAAAIQTELSAFETWFEATYREPFYAQFDQEPPEVRLVET